MKLSEHNAIAEKVDPCVAQYRGAVVSVHGMNTRGVWQKEISPVLQDAAIRHEAVDFGHVLLGALCRGRLDEVIEEILRKHGDQCRHHPSPGAIGHSMGSLAIGEALKTKPALRFGRIILFGCIIEPAYPWPEMHRRGQVERVLNEVGGADTWPKLARWVFGKNAGPSGCNGFLNKGSVVEENVNLYGRHSDLQYPHHYRDVWVRFLLDDAYNLRSSGKGSGVR